MVGYDANGNITSKTYAEVSIFNVSYTYNNVMSASAMGTNASSATYTYDSNSNQTKMAPQVQTIEFGADV